VIQDGMTHESLLNRDWEYLVKRLGGAAFLERSARETGAFRQARAIKNAVDLLRLLLAYCLGDHGLRSTAAWATSMGLVNISAPALLYRLRQSGDWLSFLIDQMLCAAAPKASRGRLIRIIDGTSVPKAGKKAKKQSNLWRVHSAFDLPGERFSYFELTDEQEGETFDRIPVVKGEIRIGDRAYLQIERICRVLKAGADVLVRGKWKGARWRDKMASRSISSPCCERPKVAASIGRSLSNARATPTLRCVWSPSASPKRPPKKRGARPDGMLSGKVIRFPKEPLRPPTGSFC
jgi:hypothetical protein